LASTLIKISHSCPLYMANGPELEHPELEQSDLTRAARPAGLMTELSWDEDPPCVLGNSTFAD
jgi:hypothetical protein